MTSQSRRILVVEDDPHIAFGLRELLQAEGYAPVMCARGDEAQAVAAREAPSLIILDVMLPGLSGYEICRRLRAEGAQVPILMLTAKGQELDKVVGLQTGADDYVTKPFGVRELLARVQALLRRVGQGGGAPTAASSQEPFRIGESCVQPAHFRIVRGKNEIDLTARELKLLQFMHQHAGEVLARERLLQEVWGYQYFGTTRTLDQVVVQLRRKLDDPAHQPRHLETVHGVGYRLRP